MSRKRTIYSVEFKTRLVLEVLKEEKTLAEIASANNIREGLGCGKVKELKL